MTDQQQEEATAPAQLGVRPWVFEDHDGAGNVMTLTVIPTPDGYIADAHSYRDSGYPHRGVTINSLVLDVPEGSSLQNYALMALGFRSVEQLQAAEVSVHDVPTAPVMDQRGQA